MSDSNYPQNGRLDPPVDDARDHALGEPQAGITLVEYGSYNCPYCQGAHDVISHLRDRFGDRMRYVFRHRPIIGDDTARRAAEFAEYAHETSGEYWQAHDALMKRGPALRPEDLSVLAGEFALPPHDASTADAERRAQAKVDADTASAKRSGALLSPTFFINGRRYEGSWDESALSEAMLGSMGHRVQTAALDFARWAPSTGLLLLLMTVMAVAAMNSPPRP